MKYRFLGDTGIRVSEICLGTMTFGQQNSLHEALEQMDYAMDAGINMIDTAEMYPVPANVNTQGLTEEFVGHWFALRNTRDKVFLATKVTGPGLHVSHISENLGFSKERLLDAIDKSLKRLQTDYIDLYQLHWPQRKTNCFGKMGFEPDPTDNWKDNIHEVVTVLHDLKKQGKIRFWGVSNETPWGVMRYINESKLMADFAPATIQNPYNLVNRTFEIGLAEMSIREKIGLLAYSPLAFGLLSGKYHNKKSKPGDRLHQFPQMARYNGNVTFQAVQKYLDIAERFGLSPAQMSLAYVLSKTFTNAVIIGATDLIQLKENIEASSLILSSEVLNELNEVHKLMPNPAP